MNQDHSALREQQVNVIDHFGAAAVGVQNGLPHQMFIQQNPTFLVVEWRIRVAGFGRRDENGFILNPHDLLPRNEFAGTSLAVFDIDPDGLRVGLGKPKNQVGEPAIFFVGLVTANPAVEQF